ncbi:hypothetical protein FRB90_004542 [Tulasnella sp. 427]|nr:hypothetical protein FRB90_004542 [Tulasnella sp. 427]
MNLSANLLSFYTVTFADGIAKKSESFSKSLLAVQLQKLEDNLPDSLEFERLKDHFEPLLRSSASHHHGQSSHHRNPITAAASSALARDVPGLHQPIRGLSGRTYSNPKAPSRGVGAKTWDDWDAAVYKSRLEVAGSGVAIRIESELDWMKTLDEGSGVEQVAAVERRWLNGWTQSLKASELQPLRIPLHSKKTKRCPDCRHILIKPEQKAQSVRYKIKLMAANYLPSIDVIVPSLIPPPPSGTSQISKSKIKDAEDSGMLAMQPGKAYPFQMTFTNPLYEPIQVRLTMVRALPKITAGDAIPPRPPFAVSLPTGAFPIAAFAEAWEYEDDEEMFDEDDLEQMLSGNTSGGGHRLEGGSRGGRPSKANVGVLERKANVTKVGGEVVISREGSGDVKFNMQVSYTYRADDSAADTMSPKKSGKDDAEAAGEMKTFTFFTLVSLGSIAPKVEAGGSNSNYTTGRAPRSRVSVRMWIIEGSFDGLDAVNRTKRKVLYPDNAYELGRGSILLHLSQTVVSTHHATIKVGPHPLESAHEPQAIPKLEYIQCNKKKTAVVGRIDEDGPRIAPQQMAELRSGDEVHISGAQIFVRVSWEPVNFLIRSGVPRDEREVIGTTLAKFGIKSSRIWSEQVTHVVFSAVSHPYDFKVLAALVHGVHLVSPAWLRHVMQKGDAPLEQGNESDSENYQMTFQGLEEEKYRPDGAGLQVWAPNSSRSALLREIRFLFITVTDMPRDIFDVLPQKELITQHRITPDDTITRGEWTMRLDAALKAVGKLNPKPGMSKPFVVAGDSGSLEQAIGPRWRSVYMEGLLEKGIRLIWLAELGEALLKTDLSYIDSSAGVSDIKLPKGEGESQGSVAQVSSRRQTRAASRQPSLPPAVASSHPEEISLDQEDPAETAPTKRLPRRATSRKETPVVEPSEEVIAEQPKADATEAPKVEVEEEEEVPVMRTLLKRRATKRAPSAEPAPQPNADTFGMDFTAIRGLKRRATGRATGASATGASGLMSGTSMQPSIQEEEEEPRHKKFKALFEGTQGPLQSVEILDDSNAGSRKDNDETIPSFVSDPLAGSSAHASKRKAADVLASVGETQGLEGIKMSSGLPGKHRRMDQSGSGKPPSQLRNQVTADDPAVPERHQSSDLELQSVSEAADSQTRQKGHAEGDANVKPKSGKRVKIDGDAEVKVEPDQDRNFLQALASRTKTKSKEDEFDREFNQLRIAVPDKTKVENDRMRQELAVWNELEHDPNLRGNFMVVEHRDDVFRKDGGSRRKEVNEAWTGAPNFKKFRKKNVDRTKYHKLELDLPPPVDYGLGDSYWQREDPNVTIGPEGVQSLSSLSQNSKPIPRRRPLELKVDSSSDEDVTSTPVKRGRAKKAAPVLDLHFSESDGPSNDAPPEEESEIFDMNVSVADEKDEDPILSNTLRSTGTKGRSQRQGAQSTNPTQSQRSSRKTSGTKRKAAALPSSEDEEEDQSDDNTAFRGFGRKKKIKR